MKSYVPLAIFSLLLLSPCKSFSAPTSIDLARVSGEISGTVNYCGTSGSEGIEVSIPGKSFVARTDYQGKFTLSYVPEGVWNLVFYNGSQRLGIRSGIQVLKRELTDLDLILGQIVLCADLDGDGFTPDQDCNDTNPQIYPGAPELCGNGLDDNCDLLADESCPNCSDNDGDGSYAQIGCGIVDCNDVNPAINPTAAESCGDGIDNDCDGLVDEADAFDAVTYYRDFDGDGFGNALETVTACNPPEGFAVIGTDCNDDNINVNPSRFEVCDNGIDDNCDEITDPEGCSTTICSLEEITAFETCISGCPYGGTQCIASCQDLVSPNCGDAINSLMFCSFSAGCYETDPQVGEYWAYSPCLIQNCPDQWDLVFGAIAPTECTLGEVQPCSESNAFGTCDGTRGCTLSGWSVCSAQTPQEEICGDAIDNDCNGQTDEGCPVVCEPPFVDCGDGSCLDLESDPNNCGTCGNICAPDEACTSGICEPACTPDCTDKECGDDGCGGSCGSCSDVEFCNDVGLCISGVCGDGVVQPELGESCDTTDFDGWTCADFGFTGGTLECWYDCSGITVDHCSN